MWTPRTTLPHLGPFTMLPSGKCPNQQHPRGRPSTHLRTCRPPPPSTASSTGLQQRPPWNRKPRRHTTAAPGSSPFTPWPYMGTFLMLLAPVLVTLTLKINSLVGPEQEPNGLALVAGAGALLAMFGNPLFGKLSDRTSSKFGMRRPWMFIGLTGGFWAS